MKARRSGAWSITESPRAVALLPHDPAWAGRAEARAAALGAVWGDELIAVHHIGSTAVPALRAKPIVDLLAVVRSLEAVERQRDALAAHGYRWRGEHGLPGRLYFTRDAATGHREVHLHVYGAGAPEIARHLRFRDRLRTDPAFAAAYDTEKTRCAALHPRDAGAYTACKSAWIAAALAVPDLLQE